MFLQFYDIVIGKFSRWKRIEIVEISKYYINVAIVSTSRLDVSTTSSHIKRDDTCTIHFHCGKKPTQRRVFSHGTNEWGSSTRILNGIIQKLALKNENYTMKKNKPKPDEYINERTKVVQIANFLIFKRWQVTISKSNCGRMCWCFRPDVESVCEYSRPKSFSMSLSWDVMVKAAGAATATATTMTLALVAR